MTPVAVCPQHPAVASIANCTRCGRFLCAECRVSENPPLCAACRPLALDPLGILSMPFNAGNTVRNGLRMFTPVLQAVVGITFAFSVPAGLLSWALSQPDDSTRTTFNNLRLVTFYDALVGVIATIACTALFIGVAEGRALSVGQALKEGTAAWGRVFGARLRGGLWVLLFALAFILPGIWKAVTLAFVVEAAVRLRGEDPLAYSTSMVQGGGRWWPVFGMLILVSLIAYGPPALIVFLLELAAGVVPIPQLPLEIFTDWLNRMAEMLEAAFGMAMFYGILKSDDRALPPMQWESDPVE
jgi:hypothetical protein